ncbi:deleted in malignant brain tumors 1 protein-like [Strongylocentrotus purpuratus]|uniref:SRCR domain-containing protein n=1 Tax=Strongylocentrotus purpuratus TaxID=7668 RepID=A0A7M7PKA1_STRPU|nr:deleted in malignant brain tumors 1 protein-like [Strongylocentrotus purpuratus]
MTVCDDYWYLREARVVCRMLGFDGALEAPGSARFGQGAAHPNPFEVRLINGSNDAEGRVEVLHDGSWGTICHYDWDLRNVNSHTLQRYSRKLNTGAAGVGRLRYRSYERRDSFEGVRLVNGSNNAEGRVEISYGGSWMTVCDDNWNLLRARVVCRMLGFDRALEAPSSARFGEGTGDILYVGWCEGTEESLADCSSVGTTYSCRHNEDAGAVCYSGAHPNPFEVRLINGSNDAEGRVEILYDGSWETICHYNWDLRDARVVCRMLGFDGALGAPRSARFGQGSGRILLTWVNCDGTEDNLADCAHRGIRDYSYCGRNGSTLGGNLYRIERLTLHCQCTSR